ncbi:MAG TPA: hypothetical protein PKY81_04175 [bacterium]|nr:hypothetical protein [bacterium]HPN30133.1 hypothetical protein [bacterium]
MSQSYFHKKTQLLEKILNLVEQELLTISDIGAFERLTESENANIDMLKQLDDKYKNEKISGKQTETLKRLFTSICSLKNQTLEKYNEEFEQFKKNDSYIQTKKELINAYFKKTSANPRFIDKRK